MRPVRPTRCVNSSCVSGSSKLMTRVTCSTSSPRAATFVASRIGVLPARKLRDDAVALALAEVALQHIDVVAHALELDAEVAHAVLRPAEDERRAFRRLVEQADEHVELVLAPDLVDDVVDVRALLDLLPLRRLDDDGVVAGTSVETLCTHSGVVAEKSAVCRSRVRLRRGCARRRARSRGRASRRPRRARGR